MLVNVSLTASCPQNITILQVKGCVQLFMGTHFRASPAICDHTVLPATQQVNVPGLNPSQTDRYSTYVPQRDGRMS